jgi:hypothetical protein
MIQICWLSEWEAVIDEAQSHKRTKGVKTSRFPQKYCYHSSMCGIYL